MPKKLKLAHPRRKDWNKGQFQVGIFVRNQGGGVQEAIWNAAYPEIQRRVNDLLSFAFNEQDEGPDRFRSKPKMKLTRAPVTHHTSTNGVLKPS